MILLATRVGYTQNGDCNKDYHHDYGELEHSLFQPSPDTKSTVGLPENATQTTALYL
jgi:hypothetical protein